MLLAAVPAGLGCSASVTRRRTLLASCATGVEGSFTWLAHVERTLEKGAARGGVWAEAVLRVSRLPGWTPPQSKHSQLPTCCSAAAHIWR